MGADAGPEPFGGLTVEFYDRIYADKDYAAEVSQVLEMVAELGVTPASVLDVACGTGAHLAEFARSGLSIAGIDLAVGMVDSANLRLVGHRSAGPMETPVAVGDLVDFDLGRRFDLVTCLFSSIGYAGSSEGLQSAVAAMARHLNPGGAIVVEPFYPPGMWLDAKLGHDLMELDGLTVVRLARSGRREDLALIDFLHAVGTPDGFTTWEEHHELLLAEPEAYLDAIARCGMTGRFEPEGFSFRGGGRGLVVAT